MDMIFLPEKEILGLVAMGIMLAAIGSAYLITLKNRTLKAVRVPIRRR